MKRVMFSFVATIVFSVLCGSSVFAQYTSSNYKAEETFFGSGGELDAASGQYKAQSSVGALGVGSARSGGPITFIQGNQNFDASAGSSISVAYSSNVTAGDLLVVAAYDNQSGGLTVSLSDSTGLTWTKAVDHAGVPGSPTNEYGAVYYAVATSSTAMTVTYNTPSFPAYRRILVHEYRGANALDVTSNLDGTGTTVSSGSATTDHPNELIFGWMLSENDVTSAGSGYTLRETAGLESTMDQIVSYEGTYQVTAPTSPSAGWMGMMATFYYNSAYLTYPGFLTPNEPFLEMTLNTSLADLGTLDSTAAKTANASFNVRAYTSSGYTVVTMSQPPQTGSGDTLNPMTSLGASTPGTEQFGMNLVANTSPASFGADPSPQPDPSFAHGHAATGYNTSNQYKYNQGDTIAQTSSTGWGQTAYTISYIGNISPITKAGQYSMVQDLVAVPTY